MVVENFVDKGNYCIIIRMKRESNIRIGARGLTHFNRGFYVYVGSALNSLTSRVERHLSSDKKKHWHIDYLLLNKNSEVLEVIYTYCTEKIECLIANDILEDSVDYVELFGCSDCNCVSHLYYFSKFDDAIDSCVKAYEKNDYEALSWY